MISVRQNLLSDLIWPTCSVEHSEYVAILDENRIIGQITRVILAECSVFARTIWQKSNFGRPKLIYFFGRYL